MPGRLCIQIEQGGGAQAMALQIVHGMATAPGVGVILDIWAGLQACVNVLRGRIFGDKYQWLLAQQHCSKGFGQSKRRRDHYSRIQLIGFQSLIQRTRCSWHYHRFQLWAMGLQVIGGFHNDSALLDTAQQVNLVLRFAG